MSFPKFAAGLVLAATFLGGAANAASVTAVFTGNGTFANGDLNSYHSADVSFTLQGEDDAAPGSASTDWLFDRGILSTSNASWTDMASYDLTSMALDIDNGAVTESFSGGTFYVFDNLQTSPFYHGGQMVDAIAATVSGPDSQLAYFAAFSPSQFDDVLLSTAAAGGLASTQSLFQMVAYERGQLPSGLWPNTFQASIGIESFTVDPGDNGGGNSGGGNNGGTGGGGTGGGGNGGGGNGGGNPSPSPVPLPAGAPLLLAGLGVLAWVRKRA